MDFKLVKSIALTMVVASATALVGCDDKDDIAPSPNKGVAAEVQSQTIADGAVVPLSTTDLTLTFNGDVAINANATPTLNGEAVAAKYASDENGANIYNTVVIPLALEKGCDYVLDVPERAFTLIGSATWCKAFQINFSTEKDPAPVINIQDLHNANATAEAKAVFNYLKNNYGKTMLTGAMGGVNWELAYTDFLSEQTGSYPAVVGFDYLHLPNSAPGSWINYGDITPVQSVWAKGSIPQISWHWNVPTSHSEVKAVVWEGEKAMPSDWSGYLQLTDADALAIWATAEVGDIVEVKTKDVSGAQGSFKNSSWSQIGPNLEYFDITGDFSMTITADILESLQAGGLIISGHDYTAVKVVLCTAGGNGDLSYSADIKSFKPSNVMVEGTWENEVATADIAKLAGYLKLLQDANIPVLWRPFHEAAGDYAWGAWFWWGAEGVQVTKQLWKYLHDKLTNEYGLNNLIWVWTFQTSEEGKLAHVSKLVEAYPGDDCVDIVGVDLYPSETLSDQSEQFNIVNSAVDGHKIIALTECGNLIDPDKAAANNALWSYFMQWYDLQDDNFGFHYYSGPDQWVKVLSSPVVVDQSGVNL